jgi:hypothetical protein
VEFEISGEFIEEPYKFSGFKIERIIAFLKVINLFEYRDGNSNIMFLEIHNGIMIEQEYRSIKDEY